MKFLSSRMEIREASESFYEKSLKKSTTESTERGA